MGHFRNLGLVSPLPSSARGGGQAAGSPSYFPDEGWVRSLLRAKGEMGEWEGVTEVQCTLGGSSMVGKTRFCAEWKC